MEVKKVLIADDHFAIRTGIKHILKSEFRKIEFGEATNSAEILDHITNSTWDILILDINMPGRTGLDILKQLKEARVRIPILVFSMYREDQVAVRALKAGASGYLSKDSADVELVKAIHQLLAGRRYISPPVAELLASHLNHPDDKAPHELLSDREYQTLTLIASGKSVSQIASELSLGVPTISTYRARILEKMGLKNNAEITHYAIENKLI